MRAALELLALVVVAGLFVVGCASDQSVICERLSECKLLPDGLSQGDCEEQALRQVPEDRLSDCADCVEREDCDSLAEACRSDCQPGD